MLQKWLVQFSIILFFIMSAASIGHAQMFTDVSDDSKLKDELTVLSDFGG